MMPPAPVPRLLVVDDEPDLRTLYELTLLREGYEVESAGAVEEAWTRLAAGGFQLLITDMVGRAKYDAWAAVKGKSADEAMQDYIDLIESLK